MAYWRMQLHPADSAKSILHATRSLGRGYIGLDFSSPPGDLINVDPASIPKSQRDYVDFAHTMALDDLVLIVAHHYPHALAKVIGDYNYIRRPDEELGVWFRHFRRVEVLGYYADYETNPANWKKTTMTDTISILRDRRGISYTLIEEWNNALCA